MKEQFSKRHIGPSAEEQQKMLAKLEVESLDVLVQKTVPASIRLQQEMHLPSADSESEVLERLRDLANRNQVFRSFIGQGYSDTITPPVILRNILENPGWYTQYTPYQAEISQGRLEALINFQTLIADLTGMDLANASLLDEGTAAAEAMMLCFRVSNEAARKKFFVAEDVHPQTKAVVETRAEPLGIEIVVGDAGRTVLSNEYCGALLQYPATDGSISDWSAWTQSAQAAGVRVVVAADLLALTLLAPPGEWGADVVVGSAQRFGVPMGFGGPHAAYFATRETHARQIPGRIVGVSRDSSGKTAYRLALQAREQHIRRERATSNICTAQVLLAITSSMYAVYHGPEGLREIAEDIHEKTKRLAAGLLKANCKLRHTEYFDTLRIELPPTLNVGEIQSRSAAKRMNLRYFADGTLGIALDETVTESELSVLAGLFGATPEPAVGSLTSAIPKSLIRSSKYLEHPVFQHHRSETELLRYIYRLQSKDLSLTTSMIPLGSCTMKLNATAEMEAITWPEFARIHPFAPLEQAAGYTSMIQELERMLCEITGFSAFSLQPNAGSQGEYAGLLVIRAYHRDRGEQHRNICLIPESAHGTNPASAAMVGMHVVVVKCDSKGNIDLGDLRSQAEKHSGQLAALMVTYPSTHGVFEEGIRHICDIIHAHGGQVYMDGANLNAQVGLCRPGEFGVDVSHLNLHKTFCIPHGGGGPGVGPIGVRSHLAPYLPGHLVGGVGGQKAIGPVSAAPWGSALILLIPWAYIRMMGTAGITQATQVALLNANYIAARLEPYFPVLYRGEHGFVAHECILDLRSYKKNIGVTVEDVAKRLMDYGFHAPTVSFPIPETLMIEPTESESLSELDRFCDALISIRGELHEIEAGSLPRDNNPLKNAPHTAAVVTASEWTAPYSRERAAYPVSWLRDFKFWPSVSRIDGAFGDRNLFCSCAPISDDSSPSENNISSH